MNLSDSPHPQDDAWDEPVATIGQPPLAHYVLLALEPEQTDLAPICLTLALDFVLAHQATVGFDPSATRQAARVTVIGRLEAVLAEELAEGNIRVDQVAADPFTLQRELEALS